jgi:NADH:ubiquinone oxidoreductase subunit
MCTSVGVDLGITHMETDNKDFLERQRKTVIGKGHTEAT